MLEEHVATTQLERVALPSLPGAGMFRMAMPPGANSILQGAAHMESVMARRVCEIALRAIERPLDENVPPATEELCAPQCNLVSIALARLG